MLYFRLSLVREKDILRQYRDKFHGIVIEAHTLETFTNSILNFIVSVPNPFIIDPVTYKFTLPVILDDTDKRWFDKLTNYYGLQFNESEPFLKHDKLKDTQLNNLVEQVINYQRNIVSRLQNILGLRFFLEAETSSSRKNLEPEYIIPPYFFVESSGKTTYRDWLDVNIRSAEIARKYTSPNEKLMVVIAINKADFLEDEVLEHVKQKYAKTKGDAFAIWISNFNEVYEDSLILKRFAEFVKELKTELNKPLINFYGGYFSLLLTKLTPQLDGVVQGITIAEHRDPYAPQGFSVPRYYLPAIHSFTSHDIATVLRANKNLSCNCPVCLRYGTKSLIDMTVTDTMEHFVYNRILEQEEISATLSINTLLNNLVKTYQLLESMKKRGILKIAFHYGHLLAWKNALS